MTTPSRRFARSPLGGGSGVGTRWTRGDLNPRPLLCESSDLPLIYVPSGAGQRVSRLSQFASEPWDEPVLQTGLDTARRGQGAYGPPRFGRNTYRPVNTGARYSNKARMPS